MWSMLLKAAYIEVGCNLVLERNSKAHYVNRQKTVDGFKSPMADCLGDYNLEMNFFR